MREKGIYAKIIVENINILSFISVKTEYLHDHNACIFISMDKF